MKTQRVIKRDATYQKFEVLKSNRNKRHRYGEFFVEGVRNINHLISEGWTVNSFLYSGEAKLSDWARDILKAVPTKVNYELTDELMAELSGKTDASELMAIVQMRPNDRLRFGPAKIRSSSCLTGRPIGGTWERSSAPLMLLVSTVW